jgi:hypothetical protein
LACSFRGSIGTVPVVCTATILSGDRILVLQAAETPTPGKQLSVEELAKGFKQYIPGGGKGEAGGAAAGGETAVEKLVRFRGTVIDLEKLMEKLDK